MSEETAPTTEGIPKELIDAIRKAEAEAREKIKNTDLKKHYREAIDYLDDNFAFFLTHVLNLGKPEWTRALPTAAVAIPKRNAKRSEFKYLFNPTFAALLEPEEFAFVMAHETMHVLLNHLKLLDTGQKSGKFKDDQKFNIAADCVINDYLEGCGLEPGRVKDLGMHGEKVVGYNCAHATVSQVYRDIPDNFMDQMQQQGDALSDYLQGSGAGQGDVTGNHDWMRETGEGQADEAEKIADDAAKNGGTPQDVQDKKEDDDKKGQAGAAPGSEAGALQRFVENKGVSMKWAELLKEVNPDTFRIWGPRPRPSYHKLRRKMIGVYERFPDLGALPVVREPKQTEGETPAIAMYLDGSGSCSAYIDKFVTLAKSVPQDKIKLFAFTFSTYVQPLDLNEKDPGIASGGTEFSIIEDSVNTEVMKELGNYPKAIVVLTDGYGAFSTTQVEDNHKDNWVWLLTDTEMRYGQRPGKQIHIDKFTEGMDLNK